MVGVSLLVTLPTLLCGLSPDFAVLVVLRTMQGFLMPGLTSVAIPYVNEEFAGKGRGLAMGIYVFGQTIGGLFARSGSALLTGLFNWRIALLAFTLPTLVAALAMWRFLPETKSKRAVEQNMGALRMQAGTAEQHMGNREFARQTLRNMLLHLHNRRLVGAFVIGFASFFGFIGIFTYLPYYLTGPHFRLPTTAVGLVYLLWLTGVFSPAAGTFAGRVGSRRSMLLSLGLCVAGMLVSLVPLLPVVVVGLGMLTLGMFSTVPAVNLYLGEQATVAKGTAASMYLSLYYFGGSIGAVLPGFALLHAGWPGVVFLCLGMILVALGADAILCH
jgi:YNFM family putative membrane transporter